MSYRTLYKPEVFQGRGGRKKYFEGWYFKCVDKTGDHVVVAIPGISYEEEGGHSFIQIILPHKDESHYFEFDKDAFDYSQESLFVQIGNNVFTDKYMYLDLKNDKLTLRGLVWFSTFVPAPVTKCCPGVMGPFAFMPFLECYHGVVSVNHSLRGFLDINDERIRFVGGKGYVEKDRGISFPEAYMWIQCNNFKKEELSFMVSVAKIPMGRFYFRGFLCTLAIKGRVRVFATYTGARIQHLFNTPEYAEIIIVQGDEKIIVTSHTPQGYLLKAPNKGAMKREVYETLHGKIDLKVYYKDVLRVHEVSQLGAYEMSGDAGLLQ